MSDFNCTYLLLGSNLEDRLHVMKQARELIAEKVGEIGIESSIYETEPWGLTDQPAFLNQVIKVDTMLGPEEVLRNILDIEHQLGRTRFERWGPRLIDIDILYYENLILDSPDLTLPHPRLQDRLFTLIPLAEIAPDLLNPLLGKNTLQLLDQTSDRSIVSKIS